MLHRRSKSRRLLAASTGVAGIALCTLIAAGITPHSARAAAQRAAARPGLVAFRSDEELRRFLAERQRRQVIMPSPAITTAVPPASPPPTSQSAPNASIVVTGTVLRSNAPATASTSITNNQETNVDEGDIVKMHGDMLVILRRGRLFTVSLAGGAMRAVDAIDAFPPGVEASDDWYDEMLVSGDRVIVIGYSYGRGGTEVNRFRIAADGRLRFEDAYHLRSNDYYSSRNYASRLIGNRLIYYTPLELGGGDGDPLDMLPAVRRWRGSDDRRAFRRIADARHVFIAPSLRGDPAAELDTMHSVISCDLAAAQLDCDATAVIGPESRNFYVSGNAVYLWIGNESARRGRPGSYLYRLPFTKDERPAAIGARGAPTDQFSFREDARARRIDVLVRSEGGGDAMWRPEFGRGSVALVQVPFRAFGDGSREAPRPFYRDLPTPRGERYGFQNRFVGDYVLYGTGGGDEPRGAVTVAPVTGTGEPRELALQHGVERIEPLGADALVVGGGGDRLGFTEINLQGLPRVGSRYVHPASEQGESRSHGFFYNPDPDSRDGASGTLGLPIAKPVDDRYSRFFGSAAAMLFLRRDDHRFSPAGQIDADYARTSDDHCRASCVDWYGNARPIFWNGRIFALMGYELVEGRLGGGRVGEVGRVSFAPGSRAPR
jgi:Beta propeller domain